MRMNSSLKNNFLKEKQIKPPIISIAILGVTMLALMGGVGYTVYNSTITTVDTSSMISSLEVMKNELETLHSSVSSNQELINKTCSDLAGTKEILNKELEIIDNQISGTNSEISSLINDMCSSISENNLSNYNNLLERYVTISGGVDVVTDNIDAVNNQISSEISYLSSSTSDNHEETINTLNSVYNNLQQSNSEFEVGINDSFGKINKEFDNMKKLSENGFSDLSDMITKDDKKMLEELAIVKNSMTSSSKENTANLNQRLDNDFHVLNQSIESFESSMNTQIESIKSEMSSNEEYLENKLALAQNSIEGKIADAQAEIEGEILGQTASLEGTLSSQTSELMDEMTDNKNSIDVQFANLESNISTVSGNMAAFESNTNTRFSQISNSISSNATSITELEKHMLRQDEKLQLVFQRASKNKNDIIEILTGYDIEVENKSTVEIDGYTYNVAPYEDINQSISKLYTKAFSNGASSVGTPNVHYEYHQHVDGSGNAIDAESSASNIGGCFDKTMVHNHNSSSTCYVPAQTCGARLETWWDEDPNRNQQKFYGRCNTCNQKWSIASCGAYPVCSSCKAATNHPYYCSNTKKAAYYKCGYSNGQVVGYEPSCGYRNGDIERAIIEYK